MSSPCARTFSSIPAFLADSLPEAERRELRGHLKTCADCRRAAGEVDPTTIFSALPVEEVSSEEIARVVEAVRAGVAWKAAERRMPPPRRRTVRIASVAAVALLTLALPAGLRVSRDEPAVRSAAPVASRPAAALPAGGFSVLADPDSGATHPAGATIYDWTPGAGQPRVVWIVDRSLDI